MGKDQKLFANIESLHIPDTDNAVFVYRPSALAQAVDYFSNYFHGQILYAVKTNPESHVLIQLLQLGIDSFDVASLNEVELIRRFSPGSKLYFMHPVKSRYAIRTAYFTYGVRHFSLDTQDELQKILEETHYANDLCLHLRLSIPNTYAEHSLSEKFGIGLLQAPKLLREIRQYAVSLGICFHVGSQCMHPDAYRIAIRMVVEVIQQTNVHIESINVGGGFPSVYPGMMPPPLIDYFEMIHNEFGKVNGSESMQLLAEPGRSLVAESTSLIVRVDLRKEDALYINDGTYGSLFDAGKPGFIYPMRLIGSQVYDASNMIPYTFYGPTCDSLDFMKGPFYLPADVKEGDLIEIGQLGAYARSLASCFNGFQPEKETFMINDPPLMTMYNADHISNEPLEIIAA